MAMITTHRFTRRSESVRVAYGLVLVNTVIVLLFIVFSLLPGAETPAIANRRRMSVILENCARTILINPGAERSWRSVARCEAMDIRLSTVFPLRGGYERLLVRTRQLVDTQVRFHWPGTAEPS